MPVYVCVLSSLLLRAVYISAAWTRSQAVTCRSSFTPQSQLFNTELREAQRPRRWGGLPFLSVYLIPTQWAWNPKKAQGGAGVAWFRGQGDGVICSAWAYWQCTVWPGCSVNCSFNECRSLCDSGCCEEELEKRNASASRCWFFTPLWFPLTSTSHKYLVRRIFSISFLFRVNMHPNYDYLHRCWHSLFTLFVAIVSFSSSVHQLSSLRFCFIEKRGLSFFIRWSQADLYIMLLSSSSS